MGNLQSHEHVPTPLGLVGGKPGRVANKHLGWMGDGFLSCFRGGPYPDRRGKKLFSAQTTKGSFNCHRQ